MYCYEICPFMVATFISQLQMVCGIYEAIILKEGSSPIPPFATTAPLLLIPRTLCGHTHHGPYVSHTHAQDSMCLIPMPRTLCVSCPGPCVSHTHAQNSMCLIPMPRTQCVSYPCPGPYAAIPMPRTLCVSYPCPGPYVSHTHAQDPVSHVLSGWLAWKYMYWLKRSHLRRSHLKIMEHYIWHEHTLRYLPDDKTKAMLLSWAYSSYILYPYPDFIVVYNWQCMALCVSKTMRFMVHATCFVIVRNSLILRARDAGPRVHVVSSSSPV